jgi:DNA-binding XRE family transcriptional regulator
MAKNFSELRSKMSPTSRDRSATKAKALIAEMPLDELRQARGLSQKTLANILHIQQPAIAKLEKRTDIYISTLRSHVEAMGGELEVIARFPEGAVKINNFSGLSDLKKI